jgi:uncharacterized cupredoxin-like copper-binding protein
MTPHALRRLGALAALVACGALAACGGDDSSSSSAATPAPTKAAAPSGGGETLALSATEGGGKLGFNHKTLSAKAGKVTITLSNPSSNSAPHAIEIDGQGSAGEIASPGSSSKVSVNLKPGKYTFFCPVGSHRAAGMEGTLTVQ